MEDQMTQLYIPVPPAPILEQAVGYQNTLNARYLALWWEPAGNEVMVSDGLVTYTGRSAGYLAYIHHKAVYPHLDYYNLGSSECPARYHLLIDLIEREAYAALCRDAEMVIAENWQVETGETEKLTLTAEEIESRTKAFEEALQLPYSFEEMAKSTEKEEKIVLELTCWLDDH